MAKKQSPENSGSTQPRIDHHYEGNEKREWQICHQADQFICSKSVFGCFFTVISKETCNFATYELLQLKNDQIINVVTIWFISNRLSLYYRNAFNIKTYIDQPSGNVLWIYLDLVKVNDAENVQWYL